MPRPLISICVPAYRADNFLSAALESVRAQTFTDWELIVTEDGSKDGTEEIVRAFAASVTQPVTYNRHEKNRGLPATRNTGIATARGAWIALLDADDYWAPRHLETLVATQQAGDLDLAHSGSILFDSESGKTLEMRRPSAEQLARFPRSLYAEGYVIQPSSVLMRKRALDAIGGYDISFRHCEDLELWFRAARRGLKFGFTGEDTCHYRKHGSALSAQGGPMSIAAARAHVKHFDWPALPLSLRRKRTAAQLEAAGRIHLGQEPGLAWGYFQLAWRVQHHPRSLLFTWLSLARARYRGQTLHPFAA